MSKIQKDGVSSLSSDFNVFNKESIPSLIQNLKKNRVTNAELTRMMVRQKFQITESEIETTTLNISLMCPLMRSRIRLPARSINCKHVQCFDLESYLMMNAKNSNWNCPICSQNAPLSDLIIDGLNLEVLEQCLDADKVKFISDGTWMKLYENEKVAAKIKSKICVMKQPHQTINSISNDINKNIKIDLIDLTGAEAEKRKYKPKQTEAKPISESDSSPPNKISKVVSYQCDDFSSNESRTEIDQQQLNDKQVIAALKKQLQEKDEKIQKQSQELREKDEIIQDLQQTNQAGIFNVLSNSFKELHVFEDENLQASNSNQ